MNTVALAKISKNKANVALLEKKKQTKSAIKREWGILPTYKLRYESPIEKGIAWYWFARYIRLRDFKRWGVCISCGKPKTFDQLQAGHYRSAINCGLDLLFDEYNVNAECEGCNGFDPDHIIGYRKNLNRRFNGAADILDERYERRHQVTTKLDFYEIASHYKIEFEILTES